MTMTHLYNSFEAADDAAIELSHSGVRIVFVGMDTLSGRWGVFTNIDARAVPFRRYRIIFNKYTNKTSIETREVTNWRRN